VVIRADVIELMMRYSFDYSIYLLEVPLHFCSQKMVFKNEEFEEIIKL
jgi:hypothetical protein